MCGAVPEGEEEELEGDSEPQPKMVVSREGRRVVVVDRETTLPAVPVSSMQFQADWKTLTQDRVRRAEYFKVH